MDGMHLGLGFPKSWSIVEHRGVVAADSGEAKMLETIRRCRGSLMSGCGQGGKYSSDVYGESDSSFRTPAAFFGFWFLKIAWG